MPTVMLDDPGLNPGVNHECMCLTRRTNVFSRVERSFFKSSFPHSLGALAVGFDPNRHHIKNL
jgi:hypothetical protein